MPGKIGHRVLPPVFYPPMFHQGLKQAIALTPAWVRVFQAQPQELFKARKRAGFFAKCHREHPLYDRKVAEFMATHKLCTRLKDDWLEFRVLEDNSRLWEAASYFTK